MTVLHEDRTFLPQFTAQSAALGLPRDHLRNSPSESSVEEAEGQMDTGIYCQWDFQEQTDN